MEKIKFDFKSRTAIVTGGAQGFGFDITKRFLKSGAKVIMWDNDPKAIDLAIKEIDSPNLSSHVVDVSNYEEVDKIVMEITKNSNIDILINNAGIMCTPFGHTTDGFEQQFGVNHLAHHLFTGLLMPALEKVENSRVVSLSSGAHLICGVDLEDPMFERRDYDGWDSYGQSKSANALFARELDRRYGERGLHAFSVHPGMIFTELGRYMTEDDMARLVERRKAQISADEGDKVIIGLGLTLTVAEIISEQPLTSVPKIE